ncbi:hypothetical protein [Caballeronia sp. TF1N1]|uniref:hypothetical protein n=2 Tax=Caballeronia TaxID=1827195 RepID=UPI001FD4C870|nr:hypothetical protein [Caballeronia sp. TF1N1]
MALPLGPAPIGSSQFAEIAMTPVALYVTPNYIASVRRGRGRECFGGTVRFIGVDALPFDIEHLCLLDRETPIEALFDAVRDAERLLNAV